MKTEKIAIIGVGNMGGAIIEGMLQTNFIDPANVRVARRNITALEQYRNRGVVIHQNNNDAIRDADFILLAVKPFQIKEVLEQLKDTLDVERQIIISVITGIWIADFQEMIGENVKIVRAMPNTAAAIGESMTCITHLNVSNDSLTFVRELFSTIGQTVFIEEKLMDAATVLGACGTAYALRYIRANIQGGIEIGFDAETATKIAAQTVKGAAALLLENKSHPEQEIDKVTTPMGCTIAGLNEMEHQGFSSSLIRGILTSYNKIVKDM